MLAATLFLASAENIKNNPNARQQTLVHPYGGMLLRNTKEQTTDGHKIGDTHQKYFAKWK